MGYDLLRPDHRISVTHLECIWQSTDFLNSLLLLFALFVFFFLLYQPYPPLQKSTTEAIDNHISFLSIDHTNLANVMSSFKWNKRKRKQHNDVNESIAT